jgi:hypothetical protein
VYVCVYVWVERVSVYISAGRVVVVSFVWWGVVLLEERMGGMGGPDCSARRGEREGTGCC